MEDPPESVLVDVVTFDGGNYRLANGLIPSAAHELQLLLKGVFARGASTELSSEFRESARKTVLAGLLVSEALALRAGLDSWAPAPDYVDDRLHVPPEASRLVQSVTFYRPDLRRFLERRGVAEDALGPLTISRDGLAGSGDDHSFQTRPFISVDDWIIVAQPASIATAIKQFLLQRAIASSCLSGLLSSFAASAFGDVADSLRAMQFERVRVAEADGENEEKTLEQVWRIDSDKLCHVLLIPDLGESFVPLHPNSHWPSEFLGELIYSRLEEARARLRVGQPEGPTSLLHLVVLVGFGRSVFIPLASDLTPPRTLIVTPEQLGVIAAQRDVDSLFLWKFAGALDAFEAQARVQAWSTLDTIALYRKHEDSFYLGDGPRLSWISVPSDMARGLRTTAARNLGRHAVRRDRTALTAVVHFYADDDHPIPIFGSPGASSPELVVEGYSCPIWVESLDLPEAAESWIAMARIVDAVAYWLWQATPFIGVFLEGLGSVPVSVQLRADPGFLTPALSSDPPTDFLQSAVDVDADRVEVHLPPALKTSLAGADNSGERVLIASLLRGLRDLAAARSGRPSASDDQLNQAMEQAAPLGLKKKVFILDGSRHPELSSQGLPRVRELAAHDISRRLDDLGTAVAERTEPPLSPGEIPGDRLSEVFRVIREHYLALLRSRIQAFHPHALLCRAIGQNEATTCAMALESRTAPTQAACFRDAPAQAKRSAERLQALTRTAIATRFLIEFVGAEPPSGIETPSDADLDDLLAIAFHFTNWGFVGEEVRVRLFNPTLSILASGRLGVRGKGAKERFGAFHEAKALEDIEAAEGRWREEGGPRELDHAYVASLNAAFTAEFGISLEQLVALGDALVQLGRELPPGEVSLPEERFVREIVRRTDLPAETVSRAITELALEDRGRWDVAPTGFSEKDIFPWHFNRNLSFVRRPLIRMLVEGTPIVYWGYRHAHRMLRALASNVEEGRYKKLARSSEMKRLLGRLTKDEATAFEQKVADYLRSETTWRVFEGQHIRPRGPLVAEADLGDIDVLAFDEDRRVAWSLECKSVNYARSPAEMSGEMAEYFIGRDGKASSTEKHHRRHKWLADNWGAVRAQYGLSDAEWNLCSAMVTEEEIPSTYLLAAGTSLPVVAFTRIVREGPSALNAGGAATRVSAR
jgi:hypothetical protein